MSGGGRYDFEDGGTYCGGWQDGKAHGHGVCTGPKGQGEYSGAWHMGFEMSGVYRWSSGNTYEGQWTQGKRHGVGIEIKGNWVYKGEWTQGFKGRYGVRQSGSQGARYEGTWTTGLQDGYGVEVYADGGQYMGQWLRGMRHGYGVRQSVPYGVALQYQAKTLRASTGSLHGEGEGRVHHARNDESRGGFVLQDKGEIVEPPAAGSRLESFKPTTPSSTRHNIQSSIRKILHIRKLRSTGDIQEYTGRGSDSMRSTGSNASTDSRKTAKTSGSGPSPNDLHGLLAADIRTDPNVTETYMGEWKNDNRCGFGVSERTDGLKYEGEWYNNKKYGYGSTTFRDGTKEEGKYKNNILVSSANHRSKLLILRAAKLREGVENAVSAAQRAAMIAKQKADIAQSRMVTAQGKAALAEAAAEKAKSDSILARFKSTEYAPEFGQLGTKSLETTGPLSASTLTIASSQQNHVMTATSTRAERLKQNNVSSQALNKSNTLLLPLNNSNKHRVKENVITSSTTDTLGTSRMNSTISNDRREKSSMLSANATKATSPLPSIAINLQPSTCDSDAFTDDGSLATDRSSRYRDRSLDRLKRLPNHLNNSTNECNPDAFTDNDFAVGLLQRRLTLPCILKQEDASQSSSSSATSRSKQSGKKSAAARAAAIARTLPRRNDNANSAIVNLPQGSLYVIDNGVKKVVVADGKASSRRPSLAEAQQQQEQQRRSSISKDLESDETEDKVAELPRHYRLEPPLVRSRALQGSMPDVSQCKQLGKNGSIMPREEVHALSERRRDELRKLQEEEERRKQWQIVFSFVDFRDWCRDHWMFVIVVVFNVMLAFAFHHLLTQR